MANNTTHNNEPPSNPSPVTADAIDKAVNSLEQRLQARIDGIDKASQVLNSDLTRVPTLLDRSILGLRELLEVRFTCLENDVRGVHDYLDTRGKDISEQITHLRELSFAEIAKVSELTGDKISGVVLLTNEKIKSLSDVTTQQFKSIVDTFAEKDKAVSVGLSAQKESAAAQQTSNTEATTKMENNFTSLLTQGRELLAEVRRSTDQQINDMKIGINLLMSRLDKGEGRTVATTEVRTDNRAVVSTIIAASVALVVIMTAIVGVVAFSVTRSAPAVQYLPIPPIAAR